MCVCLLASAELPKGYRACFFTVRFPPHDSVINFISMFQIPTTRLCDKFYFNVSDSHHTTLFEVWSKEVIVHQTAANKTVKVVPSPSVEGKDVINII